MTIKDPNNCIVRTSLNRDSVQWVCTLVILSLIGGACESSRFSPARLRQPRQTLPYVTPLFCFPSVLNLLETLDIDISPIREHPDSLQSQV